MYPIYLALLLALIVSSCLFGKTFWEKRIAVLALCIGFVFVAQLSVTLSLRHILPFEIKQYQTYDIKYMFVDSSLLNTEVCYAMLADSSYSDSIIGYSKKKKLDITDANDDSFEVNVQIDTITSDSSGTIIKRTPASQFRTNILICKNSDGDTCVYFKRLDDDGEVDLTYRPIGYDFYIRPDTIDVATIIYYEVEYVKGNNWIMGSVIPIFKNHRCLYLPIDEYDNLSTSIKAKTYYPGHEQYLAQLTR